MNTGAPMTELLFERQLPDERLLYVTPLLFGRARICIGDSISVEDAW